MVSIGLVEPGKHVRREGTLVIQSVDRPRGIGLGSFPRRVPAVEVVPQIAHREAGEFGAIQNVVDQLPTTGNRPAGVRGELGFKNITGAPVNDLPVPVLVLGRVAHLGYLDGADCSTGYRRLTTGAEGSGFRPWQQRCRGRTANGRTEDPVGEARPPQVDGRALTSQEEAAQPHQSVLDQRELETRRITGLNSDCALHRPPQDR